MSREDKTPYFLYDWKSALVAFPAMLAYVGLLPALKLSGAVEISWLWALSPFWVPFAAFWILVGFVSFVVLTVEICMEILPSKNFIDGK